MLDLFNNVSAAWVLYKLDLGIDHILIDEAQDTSPKQWQIIRTIAAEFMPGGSRPNVKRTLFAVGDEKQSIFSFQGAAPEAFDEMRLEFARQFDTPDLGWKYLRFHHSFRSGAARARLGRPGVPRARNLRKHHRRCGRRFPSTRLCPTPRPAWSNCGR